MRSVIWIMFTMVIVVFAEDSIWNKIDKSPHISDKRADGYYREGLKDIENHKYQEALDKIHKASELDASRRHYFYNDIGRVYYERKEYAQAKKWFQKSIAEPKKNYRAYYNLGSVYYIEKDYINSIKYYKEAYKLNPINSEIVFYLGNSFFSNKEYDLAIESYKKSLEIDPKYADVISNIGLCYIYKKDYKKAEESYIKAVKFDKNNFINYLVLFELELIVDKEFNKKLEQEFLLKFQKEKNIVIVYDAYKILQKVSNEKEVDEDIKKWFNRYKNIKRIWIFNDIEKWIADKKDMMVQSKLEKILPLFRKNIIDE